MPVSTFSHDSSAVRGHHGSMIARWNSTRERIADDERRRSVSEVNEMDGTSLHDRPDWPLARPKSVASQAGAGLQELEHVDDRAVMRRSKDIEGDGNVPFAWNNEPDVSDVEEEEGQRSYTHRRSKMEESPGIGEAIEDEDAEQDAYAVRSSWYGKADTLNDRADIPRSTGEAIGSNMNDGRYQTSMDHMSTPISHEQFERDVEPNTIPRSNYSDVFNSPPRHTVDFQPWTDQPNGTVSPEALSRSSTLVSMSDGHDEFTHRRNESQNYLGTLREDEVDDFDYNYNEQDEHHNELSRDVETPVPSSENGTPRSPPQASPPQINGYGSPGRNGHNRISSIAKGTPPSVSASRRSSWIMNNNQNNRNKVRYSWQSLQGDEPSRPRVHLIKVMSETATAAAGFPGGEAFGFSMSPGGRRIVAYNSARLYVIQTAALPVGISQDYTVKRRPLAVEINDEGNVLAILADEHTINVYDLGHGLRRTKTIKLDFPTDCIALAPTGGLLAAAYTGGVEIFSLDPNALPTDRRAVRSPKMDRLSFSADGSTLLGTTTRINASSTVLVSVPVFPSAPSGVPTHAELKEAWCSELLHPENVRNSSHATFLREKRTTCNDRVFAWNGLADTFGVLNVPRLSYGNVDFPVVTEPQLSLNGGLGAAVRSCPVVDEHGDTVAMIVNDRTIRLYIIPHRADEDETTIEAHSIDHELDEDYGCPFSDLRWVHVPNSFPVPPNNQNRVKGRLIVTSPGGVVDQTLRPEETVEETEAGRIMILDFDPHLASQPGQLFNLSLGKSPPQALEEEVVDVADQVALVRRRTVKQNKSGGLSQRPPSLGRAATTYNGSRNTGRTSPNFGTAPSGRRSVLSIHSLQSEGTRSLPDLLETTEAGEVMEEPYQQNAPRSHASLQRAASNVQRHRFQALEERTQERVSVDSTGHFLPLPEYTEEPNAPLPSRFRVMAGLDGPMQPSFTKPSTLSNVNTSFTNGGASASSTGLPPMSAPAAIGENFSAEQAFIAAAAAVPNIPPPPQMSLHYGEAPSPMSPQSPTSPMGLPPLRTGTFDSVSSMPRSLQRAYSNAMPPIGNGPAPSLIGDWENVSPVVSHQSSRNFASSPPPRPVLNGTLSRAATFGGTMPEDEDIITPVVPPGGQPRIHFRNRPSQTMNAYRHSTSLLDPPGHPTPSRSVGNLHNPGSAHERRMPPHMRAFREAAAAAAANPSAASLFPPNEPTDRLSHRMPSSAPGTVGHPITAWHPPASSIPSPPSTGNLAPSESISTLSRKNSITARSGITPSTKSRRRRLFGRKKTQPYLNPGFGREDDAGSKMETRSMFTTMTRGEGKCTMM